MENSPFLYYIVYFIYSVATMNFKYVKILIKFLKEIEIKE